MSLSAVIGHENSIAALRRALQSESLAGTYLFVGPHGIGKTRLALEFAMAAACLDPTSDPFDSCGRCESCKKAESGAHPEIVLLSPAGDQTQIWQFWDRDGKPPGALQRAVSYAPVIGRRKVFIIERADTLNEATANSLLKVLEEPPPYVVFVLLAPHPARLLETVLSRSQVLRLSPRPVERLASDVEAMTGVDAARARMLATYAEGRTGIALALARSKDAEAEMDRVLEVAVSMPFSDPLSAPKLGEQLRKVGAGIKALTGTENTGVTGEDEPSEAGPRERLGRKQLGIVVDLLVTFYRDLLSIALGGPSSTIALEQRRDQLTAIASASPAQRWKSCLEQLLKARRQIDQNANTRLLTDWLAINLVTNGR